MTFELFKQQRFITIVYIAVVYSMLTYFLIVYFSNLLEYLDLKDHYVALPWD